MADEETGSQDVDLPDDGRGDPPEAEAGRRRWPVVTAVAAAVAVISGGLYGVQGSGGSDAADGSADATEPLLLDEDAVGMERFAVGSGGLVDDGFALGGYALTLTAVGDLPDGPERAADWRFDGDIRRGSVADLAEVLGLDGSVAESGGSWTVTGTDPDAPMLTVSKEAPGYWWYGSSSTTVIEPLEGWTESGGTAPDDPDDPDTAVSDGDEPADDGAPPSTEEALSAAEPLLAELGLSEARTDASTTSGSERFVRVLPLVDGLPVHGLGTRLSVDRNGQVASAGGTLTLPNEEGLEWEVTGADEAITAFNERGAEQNVLRDPRCGAGDAIEPAPMPEPEEFPGQYEEDIVEPDSGSGSGSASNSAEGSGAAPDASGDGNGVDAVPPADSGGTGDAGLGDDLCAEAPKAEPVEVTAEFGLALHSSDGEPLLVPSWLFSPVDGEPMTFLTAEPAVPFEYAAGPGDTTESEVEVDVSEAENPAASDGSGAGDPDTGDSGDGAVGQERPSDGGGVPADPPSDGMAIESYAADGETLTVHYWAGVCDEYTATAEESGGEITVRVTADAQESDGECILVAEQRTAEVRLDEPVGDRVVVDAHGAEIPVR